MINKKCIIQNLYMDISNMKNIVVLKNLPSNLIEEAIVVLKANKKIKKLEYSENKQEKLKSNKNNKENKNEKDYILKEAELVVSNYISKIENQNIRNNNKELEKKYKKFKTSTVILAILLTVSSFFCII